MGKKTKKMEVSLKKKGRKSKKIDLISEELNEKQKLFCFLFVFDKDCFGNATRAYQKAYQCSYEAAKNRGNQLLTNAHIIKYKNWLLDQMYDDKEIDRILIRNMAQIKDLQASNTAAKELNRVKARGKMHPDPETKNQVVSIIKYLTPNGNNSRTHTKAA